MRCTAYTNALALRDSCLRFYASAAGPRLDAKAYTFYTGMSNTACVELNNGLVAAAPGHALVQQLVDGIKPHEPTPIDPLAAALGSMGGGGMGGVLGLIGAMAGTQDVSAVRVAMAPPDAFMGTIERTGPGFFTRTVMRHLAGSTNASGSGDGGGEEDNDRKNAEGSEKADDAAGVRGGGSGDGILVLPTSFFYPVPNNHRGAGGREASEGSEGATATTDVGDASGSTSDDVPSWLVPSRRWIRPETLAVHHWAQSWQT